MQLFYMVISGRVTVQFNGVVMTYLEAGQTFGDKAMQKEPTKSPTYLADTFTKCACLSEEDYFNYLHEHARQTVSLRTRVTSLWLIISLAFRIRPQLIGAQLTYSGNRLG
jgi:signal-transduction protein with cAMP-binding, CBS, and nucleotidyltransferase domain